jgi:cysteine desulfurase
MPESHAPPIYLDANASEPALACALDAARRALDTTGNPSSPHAIGRAARRLLDEARDAVATALGARARDIVFTSGATEGNRFVMDALTRSLPHDALVVTTSLEHPSVRKPLEFAPCAVQALPLEGARVVPDAALLARADAIIVTAAHNETGVIIDIDALLAHVRDDAIVCVDAAQAVARLPVLPSRVDVIVSSAHKLGALAGAGALVWRGQARRLAAPWRGGGQEAGMRPGTENVVGIAALGAACARIDDTRALARALAPLRDALERALVPAWDARVIGQEEPRLAQTTALCVADVDGEALRIALDLAGVCVGFGAACSALAPEPSPALLALGLTAAEARATVRLSLPLETTQADIDEAIARVREVPSRIRSVSAPRG